MSSIEKINEESKQFAKEWRGQLFRNFLAIISSAILLVTFSPGSLLEYAASILVIMPLFLWAHKRPKRLKHRFIITTLFLVAAVVIYSGTINGS